MADVTLSDAPDQDSLNVIHLIVGLLVLTTGVYFAATAVQYLFFV